MENKKKNLETKINEKNKILSIDIAYHAFNTSEALEEIERLLEYQKNKDVKINLRVVIGLR